MKWHGMLLLNFSIRACRERHGNLSSSMPEKLEPDEALWPGWHLFAPWLVPVLKWNFSLLLVRSLLHTRAGDGNKPGKSTHP